jgi:tetratricopeptide (TPR) repeat protein
MAASDIQAGNFPAALEAAQRAAELGYEYGNILAYQALSRLGEFDRAEVELRKGLKHESIDPKFIDVLLSGQQQSAWNQTAIKAVAANLSLPDQAYIFADIRAYRELFKTFENLHGTLLYLSLPVLWDSASAELRRQPGFLALVKEQGLLDYWLASQQWPDICQPAAESIECDVVKVPHP